MNLQTPSREELERKHPRLAWLRQEIERINAASDPEGLRRELETVKIIYFDRNLTLWGLSYEQLRDNQQPRDIEEGPVGRRDFILLEGFWRSADERAVLDEYLDRWKAAGAKLGYHFEWLYLRDYISYEPTMKWMTGLPNRDGAAIYVHLIRGPNEPKPPRPGRDQASAWRQRFHKSTVPKWRSAIIEHLSDGKPCTFNSMMIAIARTTADVVAGKAPDIALWELVDEQLLEYTTQAPILFRRRHSDLVDLSTLAHVDSLSDVIDALADYGLDDAAIRSTLLSHGHEIPAIARLDQLDARIARLLRSRA